MPRFCFWIQDLLKRGNENATKGKNGASEQQQQQQQQEGRLVYIIGGEVENSVSSRLVADIPIDDLLRCKGASDKRTVVLRASDVLSIANESGEKKRSRVSVNSSKKRSTSGGRNTPKGAWAKKDNSVKKQRGYEDFKRFGSN